MATKTRSRLSIVLTLVALVAFFWPAQTRAQSSLTSGPGSASSIPQSDVIQAEALKNMLQVKGPSQPVLLQVGSHILFDEAHIPGSIYAGPGSQTSGLQLLQKSVASLAKDKLIVLYCGCCPWNRCPNVAPAFQQLRAMGYTNVKVLYLPSNFGADWVAKGYPVARTQ